MDWRVGSSSGYSGGGSSSWGLNDDDGHDNNFEIPGDGDRISGAPGYHGGHGSGGVHNPQWGGGVPVQHGWVGGGAAGGVPMVAGGPEQFMSQEPRDMSAHARYYDGLEAAQCETSRGQYDPEDEDYGTDGTFHSNTLPEGHGYAHENLDLSVSEENCSKPDVDYIHVTYLTEDLERLFPGGFGSAAYQNHDMRGQLPYDPTNFQILHLAMGPGLLYIAVPKADIIADIDGDEEVEPDENNNSLKYRVMVALYDVGGPVLRPSSDPLLLASAHQPLSTVAIMEALQSLDIKTVAWVRIGAKEFMGEMAERDLCAQACDNYLRGLEEEEPREEGDPRRYKLRNIFDIGREFRPTEGEDGSMVRRVYFVKSQPVQFCEGDIPVAFRTYPLAPGLFPFACGSIQSSGVIPEFLAEHGIERLTIYNGPTRHSAQAAGSAFKTVGLNIRNARTRIQQAEAYLNSFLEHPELLLTWCGIRVETRVRAATASDALEACEAYELLNPCGLLARMGQYTLIPTDDPEMDDLDRARFPLYWTTPEVLMAHCLRVLDAAKLVIRGRNDRKCSRRQLQAQVDLLACLGSSMPNYRATRPQDVQPGRRWWVVEAERNTVPAAELASEESSDDSSDSSSSDDEDESKYEAKEEYEVNEVPPAVKEQMMAEVKFRGSIGRGGKRTWTQTRSRVCEDTGNTISRGPRNPCDSDEAVCDKIWATYGPEWRSYVSLK